MKLPAIKFQLLPLTRGKILVLGGTVLFAIAAATGLMMLGGGEGEGEGEDLAAEAPAEEATGGHGAPAPQAPADSKANTVTIKAITPEYLKEMDAELSQFSAASAGDLGSFEEVKGIDYRVLHTAARASDWRFELNGLIAITSGPNPRRAGIQCVVEFGSESGPVELQVRLAAARSRLRQVVASFTSEQLFTTAGKLELKEAMIGVLNETLTRSRVRQIYYTHFELMFP